MTEKLTGICLFSQIDSYLLQRHLKKKTRLYVIGGSILVHTGSWYILESEFILKKNRSTLLEENNGVRILTLLVKVDPEFHQRLVCPHLCSASKLC